MTGMTRNLDGWDPECAGCWQAGGQRTARRNLLISMSCLLLGFATWMVWSVLIVQMEQVGFPFSKSQLYQLPAIAGLSGAMMRLSHSFLLGIAGGRLVMAASTLLLAVPALLTGLALRDRETSYTTFCVLAMLSGQGGAVFASSMANISGFFPKRMQGMALGVNAGIGNLGVSLMQFTVPVVAGCAVFGALTGPPLPLVVPAGGRAIGSPLWIQNSTLMWVPLCLVCGLIAWFGASTLPPHTRTAQLPAFLRATWVVLISLAAAGAGLYLLIGLGLHWLIVLPLATVLALLAMRYGTPAAVRASLQRQFAIFPNRHTWIMTLVYTMSFGSFIGFSASFPKFIQDIFSTGADGASLVGAPNPFHYAWIGPLLGSLMRAVGGWLSDRMGGARVTCAAGLVMLAAVIALAIMLPMALASADRLSWFPPFLVTVIVLFICSGLSMGANFRIVPFVVPAQLAGAVLGWTSAIAAYGAFVIPKILGQHIAAHTPERAFFGFAAYYSICLALVWWFYLRHGGVERVDRQPSI
jgi:NNP family nitrate/nitrite transporter-like MFS transporter